MKLLLLLFALGISLVWCDDSIDTQIEQVMNAKSSERYELMNQLKSKLATMNENERNEALQKLSRGKNLNRNGENHGSGLMLQTHQPSMSKQHQPNSNNAHNRR